VKRTSYAAPFSCGHRNATLQNIGENYLILYYNCRGLMRFCLKSLKLTQNGEVYLFIFRIFHLRHFWTDFD